MDRGKEKLKRYIENHLKNIIGRGVECELFGSFYDEGEGVPQRCLLPLIKDQIKRNYFTSQEAREICPYQDRRFRANCKYSGNPTPSKKQT